MKQKLLFLLLLSAVLLPGIGNAQITATDAGGCLLNEDTWSPAGTVAGHTTYEALLTSGSAYCRVQWNVSLNRWEIIGAFNPEGVFAEVLYFNNTNTTPNPPALSLGGWTDSGSGCGPLTQFSGPYTATSVCTAPTITVHPPNRAICAGNNTTFTVSATGATAYQWQVNTGSGFSDITNSSVYSGATTTTLTITGATAAMNGYQYRAVAINGSASCFTNSNSAELTVTNITASITSQTNVSCFGGANGSATVTASGGTGQLSYSWSPSGGTAATATGLVAGTYTVTITDELLCSATATVTVDQPTSPVSGTTVVSNVSCNGGSNGAIDLTPAGGTSPFTYNWADGPTTQDRINLTAGTYTVTIVDNNSCVETINVTVNQPSAVSGTTVVSNVSCNGGANGTINLTPTGGTSPYTFDWGGGITTEDRTGLTAGTYSVEITDANSCTGTVNVTVNQPSAVSASTVVTNIACFGEATGAINLTPTGGTSPYTFDWGGGITTEDRTGLTAGTYSVEITDAIGCTGTVNVTVNQPSAVSASTVVTNIACFGEATGAINLTPTGGTSPYTFDWGGGITTEDRTGLTAGTYTVEITDATGCTGTVNVTIDQPSAVSASTVVTNIACFGEATGAINLTPTGGTGPYTFDWGSGITTEDRTNLTAGTYTVEITDAIGCTGTVNVTVNQPSAVSGTTVVSNVSCNGGSNGSINLTPTGGTSPYTFDWGGGITTEDRTGLTAGTYSVEITDANSCTGTVNVTVNQPSAVSASTVVTNIACFGEATGAINLTPTGGTSPYTFDWGGGITTEDRTGLTAGTYSVEITDAIGCTGTVNVTVNQPTTALTASASGTDVSCFGGSNGSATVTAGGGTGNLSYSWSPSGGTAATATGLSEGTYTVTVTDENSCTATETVIIDITPDITDPVADITELNDIIAECEVTAGMITVPTATDNCASSLTGTTSDPLTYTQQGTYTITWTYDDGNGNTATQTQNVIVEDTTDPIADVTALTDIVVQCEVEAGAISAPTATDNCVGSLTGTTSDPLTYTQQGTYTITWTYDDGNGNTATQTQNVIVEDTTDPVADVATLADIVVECEVEAGVISAPTATDNCAGTLTATTTDPLTYTQQGNYTITWTYDDGNGNTATQTQNVIVEDTTDPIADVTALTDIVVQCEVEAGVITAPTATDNCAGVLTGTTTDPLTYTQQGTYTITWTYDDGNGNTATQTQNVIVEDTTDPIADVTVLADIVVECEVEAGVITAPTATDNCAGVLTGTTTDPLTYNQQGTYTITWTYDDGNGNTATQTQNVIVEDTTDPIADVTALTDIVVQCEVEAGVITAPTATDNCAGVLTGTTTDPLTYTQQGTYTITWTYDDGNGNTSTQTQNVIVEDTTDPIADVTVLADIVVQCEVEAGVITAPTATDNCVGTVTATTTDPLTYTQQGTYTITWTYDDGNGNTATQTQNVIVEDTTDPIADVTILADIVVECEVEAGVITAPTATDNCVGTIIATTTDPLTYTQQGTYTITWTYDDGNGNTATQTQNVIVEDTTDPIADVTVLTDIVVECEVEAGVITAPIATDNCGGSLTATTTDPLTYTGQGTYTITWTYNDGNGNTATQTQNVIVEDTTDPIADVATLADIVVQCEVEAGVISAPTATDNCAGVLTGTTSDPLTYTQQGTYTITWTYDDGNGNTATQTQNVIVEDTTDPIADVATLADIVVQCEVEAGVISAPTATDNCAGVLTGTTSDPLTYTQQGTYTITWTYDDGNGNTATQTQNVIVEDTTDPIADIVVLADIVVECEVEAGAIAAPTATDNCAGVLTGTTTDPLMYTEQGTYTITWTYDDGNGNTATQTQNVIVEDTTDPIADVTVLADIVVECEVEAGVITAPTATDNCADSLTATTTDPLTYTEQGTYTITWTYDDGNGNTATQTQNVIVEDTIDPIADVATLADIVVQCEVEAGVISAPTATDNCAGSLTGTTSDPLTYTGQGTYTITWTYNDGNGNTATQTQNVIVEDTTDPVADIIELDDVVVQCEVEAGVISAPTATDNCVGTLTATTTNPLTYTQQGTYTITWTYDDGNGNTATQTQNVIVEDTIDPIADVATLADIVVQCEVEAGVISAPTATDNCAGTLTATTTDPLTYTQQGTYTITWTYDDGNGNTATQTQNVIVEDTTDPIADVTVLTDIVVECEVEAGVISAPTATDNCAGSLTGTTSDPLTYTQQGNYTITWTYDDGNGNTATQTQNVIVEDTTDPIADVTALTDIVVQCEVEAGVISAPTATDNCAGVLTATTTDPLTYNQQGTYTITWTYDDGNGNTATQTQNVIVEDTTDPVADVTNLPDIINYCGIMTDEIDIPTATDNCSGTLTASTSDPLEYTTEGNYTITWTYDDGNGNTTTQTQNVIVEASPLDEVTFNDALFVYDGNVQGVEVDNLPQGATVTYNISLETGSDNGAVNAGEYTVTATVSPQAEAFNCEPVVLTALLTIERAPQTIVFDALPVKNLETDPDFQLEATASSGLEVYYTYDFTSPEPAATVTPEGFVDMLTSGEITITAHQDGNDNYLPAEDVSQVLIIESSDASVLTLTIGDEVYENPSDEVYYLIECGDTADSVQITMVTESGATVEPGLTFSINTPQPGIYSQTVTVTSQDGTVTQEYTITVEKRFEFSDIVVQKFDNVLLVNNNPQNNGGYQFTAYQWYKNGIPVGTGQYFSEGDNPTDALDPDAEYMVKVTTAQGEVLQTCIGQILLLHSNQARLYPNPVVTGRTITIEADFPVSELQNMEISIYSLTGSLITTVKPSTLSNEIQIPVNLEAATYIVVLNTPNIRKSFKLVVDK